MKRLRLFLVWMAVAVLAASPAPAENRAHPLSPVVLPETFIFRGDDFILPAPVGFCAPSGAEAVKLRAVGEQIAQNLFTKDPFKVRGLLVRCPTAPNTPQTPDILMVGVVPLANKVAMDRRAFLAAVALKTDPDPGHPNRRITPSPTLQYVGWDDYGLYMTARVDVGPAGEPQDMIEMIGATLVKQRIIGLVLLAPKDSPAGAEGVKRALLAEARSFVELNEALEPPIGWTPKRPNRPRSAIAAGSGRRRRAKAGSSGW